MEFNDGDQDEWKSLLDQIMNQSSSSYLGQNNLGTDGGGSTSLSDRIASSMNGGGTLESSIIARSSMSTYGANMNGSGSAGSGSAVSDSVSGSGMDGYGLGMDIGGGGGGGVGANVRASESSMNGGGSNMYGHVSSTRIVGGSSSSSNINDSPSDSGFGSSLTSSMSTSLQSGANVVDGSFGMEESEVISAVSVSELHSSYSDSSRLDTASVSQVNASKR